ncbi:hypothetical protein FOZ63_020348 [Perkinsus olseni]|uniref:Uncharacterized protein n=1 Tax=Perkinsus olseni TaxID=32597 RepID=A0A7J6TYH4_PEROL|nr:hypothetical protein FOZ63_020348 [Perkinsus olseni]
MIHIPQVYGATPFNSDNDEDPMEADAHGSRKKVRARRSRRADPPTAASHATSGKRKWEMQSPDPPQAKKLMASREDGTCRAVLTNEVWVDEERNEIHAPTCRLQFTEDGAVEYSTETKQESGETSRVVGVTCGEKSYMVADGRIDAILMGEDMYDVGRDDPAGDFNNRAFGLGCLDIFHEIQRTLQPGSREGVHHGQMHSEYAADSKLRPSQRSPEIGQQRGALAGATSGWPASLFAGDEGSKEPVGNHCPARGLGDNVAVSHKAYAQRLGFGLHLATLEV